MFDIVKSAENLFGVTATFCKEILFEFNAEYKISKMQLPTTEMLIPFRELVPKRDLITIIFSSDFYTEVVKYDVAWKDKYDTFLNGLSDGDEIKVSLKISKVIEKGILSIYHLETFSKFLCGLKIEQIFENFTRLFRDCGNHITFQLLDSNGLLKTKSIAFSNNEVQWIEDRPREELLKDCEDAGIFLERRRFHVVPQDFAVGEIGGGELKNIQELFGKLQTVLSFIYLANTATVLNDKAVLQFNPSSKGYEFRLAQLTQNTIIPQIYDWVFRDKSCVDKASIARNIINTYCKNRDSILTMDEKVLNSIKSDYLIYLKNNTEKYIEVKNKISEHIVDCTEKIQKISYDIADAFRNNLVAIMVFAMTVFLTDSIDLTRFFEKEISPTITAVCGLFTGVTFIYYKSTIFMGDKKWGWLRQSYYDLKQNYENVLVDKDIDDAFKDDAPIKHAEENYQFIRQKIGAFWVAIIVFLGVFTVILFLQGQKFISWETLVLSIKIVLSETEKFVW